MQLERKLKVATIALFMRAMLDELDQKFLRAEYVIKIHKRCKKFVSSNFVTKYEQDLLDKAANESWDLAVTAGEFKSIAVSAFILKLYDSSYREYLEKDVRINKKHVEKLYNASSDASSLSIKLASRDLANESIKIINKVIYNTLKE